MMKKYKHPAIVIFMLTLIITIISACVKDVNTPLYESGDSGNVDGITVENLPGKSKITYNLPKNNNILYVKAKYKLADGREMEVKSSIYENSVLIEGFADATEREVLVSTVNKSEQESTPIKVTIKPLPSPLQAVFNSLNVGAAFGGIFVNADNPERIDVAIQVMEKDDKGDWEISKSSIYTSTDKISRTIRGLDTTSYNMAFVVRDRFLNYTDTLFKTIKPLFETEIPSNSYAGVVLPGDAPATEFPFPLSRMWDNDYRNWPRIYITDVVAPAPHSFTLDLGKPTKLSRVKIWDYPQAGGGKLSYYYQFNMRYFEIWGSNDPSSDGSYASWTKIGDYEQIKPSGLPYGQQSDEDLQFAMAGFNYDVDITLPKFRYIRIKNLANWVGGGRLAIAEIRFYGDNR